MAVPLSSLRLLIISPPPPHHPSSPSPFPLLLHALTGTRPTQDQVSSGFAGYTQHPPLQLRTKYYSADVGIWCDEVPLSLSLPGTLEPVQPQSIHASDRAGQAPASVDPLIETEADSRHLPSSDIGRVGVTPEAILTDKEHQVEAPPSLSTWRATMLSGPAREVREAVGGIVLALPLPISLASNVSASTSKQGHYLELIEAVDEVRQMIEDENSGREVPAVVLVSAIGKGVGEADLDATTEKLEAVMLEERGVLGWEFVGWNGKVADEDGAPDRPGGRRNAFGERLGMRRVKELLEAGDWSTLGGGLDGKDVDAGFLSSDDEGGPFIVDGIKLQGQELEREMMGLKLAMTDQDQGEEDAEEHNATSQDMEEDEDLKIEQLPGLLERVVAIREAGADMSKAEREKFANREVERIMRDLI